MNKAKRKLWFEGIAMALVAAACSSPNKPSDNTPANRAPTIASITATPTSGVSTFTTHVLSASASDPDGGALTYLWDTGDGRSGTSATVGVVYQNANTTTYTVRLTVTDSQGLTATATTTVVSATIAGTFTGTLSGSPISATLTQFVGGLVGGTWAMPTLGVVGEVGPAGEPGTINGNREFALRFKVRSGGSFDDFFYRGTMSANGQTLTGTLTGSGFNGQTLVLSK